MHDRLQRELSVLCDYDIHTLIERVEDVSDLPGLYAFEDMCPAIYINTGYFAGSGFVRFTYHLVDLNPVFGETHKARKKTICERAWLSKMDASVVAAVEDHPLEPLLVVVYFK